MYARLEGGRLIRAPKMLDVEKDHVYNPTPAQLTAAGYKPVTYTDPPEAPEGWYAEAGWAEQADAIIQTWTLRELPQEEPTAEKLLEILLGGDGV